MDKMIPLWLTKAKLKPIWTHSSFKRITIKRLSVFSPSLKRARGKQSMANQNNITLVCVNTLLFFNLPSFNVYFMGQTLVLESMTVAVLHPKRLVLGKKKSMQTAAALISLPSMVVFFSVNAQKSKDVWLWLQLRNYSFT